MTWMVPPEYVVLDIETIAGDPVEAEEWARRSWSPNRQWKPATIGQRYLEVLEKKEEQLALLDGSPIISVALRTPTDLCVLHWLPVQDASIAGARLEAAPDQPTMLRRLRDYLSCCGPETTLVGHNILRFDLPKLRRAIIAAGLRLPICLVDRDQPVYDTMREWSRFSLDERPFVGLGEVLEVLGLPSLKEICDGAQVPELYRQGRFQEILAYAVADVLAQWQAFLWMTGQAADRLAASLPPPAPAGGHELIEQAAAREVAAGPNGTIQPEGEAAAALAAQPNKPPEQAPPPEPRPAVAEAATELPPDIEAIIREYTYEVKGA